VIARLRGKPVARTAEGLVLDVNGVGYLLAATSAALRKADGASEVALETYLHVREDALQLYGVADRGERDLFVQLLSVNVSGSPAADLRRAIVLEDTARFVAIPGIGKKTAERIVLELKEKLADAAGAASALGAASSADFVARDALVELGYSLTEAEQALADVDPDLPAEQRIRLALRKAA
jgi:holliday junction DNA helicase RuvA